MKCIEALALCLEGRQVGSGVSPRAVDIPQRAYKENKIKRKGVRTSNDSSSKSVTTIKTDTIATSRAVHLNLAGIGLEALSRVLGL